MVQVVVPFRGVTGRIVVIMEKDALDQFASSLLQEIATEAGIEGQESTLSEAFTQSTIDLLTEQGVWQDGQACYHRSRAIEVSGWGWDNEEQTLDLCVTAFTSSGEVSRLSKADADALVKRLRGFFIQSTDGLEAKLEESSPQFDLAFFIQKNFNDISKVRLSVFSNQITGLLSDQQIEDLHGIACSLDVWDLERLHRLGSNGHGREPIEIDFVSRFGQGLQCLEAHNDDEELRSFLAVIPGQMLADIYLEFGARLLELNVRSFLQATGAINRGIRKTLNDEPARFFSYNNGISATASGVTMSADGSRIESLSDLQIVNGGQTTASIAVAVQRDKADVSHVAVQVKLTVVPAQRIEEIVPFISRFANSQNRISTSDLSANHPYHVEMEKISRTVWAPSPEGGVRETRWFYERARGQYNDALYRERTTARRKAYKIVQPPSQKFNKTDLAKYELTWRQKPYIVSRGAQKSFAVFMHDLAKQSVTPDQKVFEQLCSKAIMFRTAEKIVQKQKFGGYRANIVTYTLAWIHHQTSMSIDLDKIWKQQACGPCLAGAIELLCGEVYEFLTNPPGGANITEFAKRESCWELLLKKTMPEFDVSSECAQLRNRVASPGADPQRPDSVQENEEIVWVKSVPCDNWFGISAWAKDTNQLQSWQRSISFSLGKLAGRGKEPSRKQARQGRLLYDEAIRLGWKSE